MPKPESDTPAWWFSAAFRRLQAGARPLASGEVLIPIVEIDHPPPGSAHAAPDPASDGPAGSLLKIYGEPVLEEDWEREKDKGLNPALEGLPLALKESAEHAFDAVKTLWRRDREGTGFDSLYRLRRLNNRGIIKNLKGDSAELGLALCLLLDQDGGQRRAVAATGKLKRDEPGRRDGDVEVLAVGYLREKMRLLAAQRTAGAEPILFLTPEQHEIYGKDGERRGELVASLRDEIAELAKRGVTVRPVKTLGEAARLLDLDPAPAPARQRPGRTGWRGALAAMAALLAAVAALALNRPLELDVLEHSSRGGGRQPYIVCGEYGPFQPLRMTRERVATAPAGRDLGIDLQIGASAENDSSLLRRLRGWPFYYQGPFLAFILVQENESYSVRTDTVRHRPGQPIADLGSLPLDGWTGGNKLIILVRRWQPFNNGAIQKLIDGERNLPRYEGQALEQFLADKLLSGRRQQTRSFRFTTIPDKGFCDANS